MKLIPHKLNDEINEESRSKDGPQLNEQDFIEEHYGWASYVWKHPHRDLELGFWTQKWDDNH